MNQVLCNEVRLRQSRNRQGRISGAGEEWGWESRTLGSDCVPNVRSNHTTRGRLDVEFLRNHVVHGLSWLIRARCLDTELTLKVSSETGLFEGTLACRIRRGVSQSHHAIP